MARAPPTSRRPSGAPAGVERSVSLSDAGLDDDLRAVGPYIAPVKLGRDGKVQPGNLRERIRSSGPTIDIPLQVLRAKADHVSVR